MSLYWFLFFQCEGSALEPRFSLSGLNGSFFEISDFYTSRKKERPEGRKGRGTSISAILLEKCIIFL